MLTWITPRYNLDRCFQWFSSSLLQPIKLIIFTQQPLKTAHVCPVFLLWLSRDKYLLCRYCLPTDQPSELIDGNLSHSVCKLLKPRTKGKTFFSCQNIAKHCKRVPERPRKEISCWKTFSHFTYQMLSLQWNCFFSRLAPGNSRSQRYLVPHQSMSLIGSEDALSTQYSICFFKHKQLQTLAYLTLYLVELKQITETILYNTNSGGIDRSLFA